VTCDSHRASVNCCANVAVFHSALYRQRRDEWCSSVSAVTELRAGWPGIRVPPGTALFSFQTHVKANRATWQLDRNCGQHNAWNYSSTYLIYDIFVNCNWVATRWQQYSTHLHTVQQYSTHLHTNSTAVQYTFAHKQYSSTVHIYTQTVQQYSTHLHTNSTAVQYTFTHKQYAVQHN
jgi:hypothetical protein